MISKLKFLSLSFESQHKKIAFLLRKLFLQKSQFKTNCWETYGNVNNLLSYLELEPLKDINLKLISDLYHTHLRLSKTYLKEHNFLPNQLDKLKRKANILPIWIYLENLRSAHNVGSILRTIEALQLGTVAFSLNTPDLNSKKVKNTSMGAYNGIIGTKVSSLRELPRPIIALETVNAKYSLFDFSFPSSFTLAVGNEEYGLSDALLNTVDEIVQIPLVGKKNSLNVANAFSMAAFEISKQKRGRQ